MFVRVVRGPVADRESARTALQRCVERLSPESSGWLGTTAGVTEDGQLLALESFESEEAAHRTLDPGGGGQWSTQNDLFTGNVIVRDSKAVLVIPLNGDLEDATFVRILEGRYRDPERARALMTVDLPAWATFAPHLLGGLVVDHAEGAYTTALYYTSEDAAREAEFNKPPGNVEEVMKQIGALNAGMPTLFTLRQPWLLQHYPSLHACDTPNTLVDRDPA
ncbi:MAG: hypothetical protein QOF52_933 [Propionibacteriaceae bacterium]|nr:hypothetical protein [Propionibacteriaceae bacterium]